MINYIILLMISTYLSTKMMYIDMFLILKVSRTIADLENSDSHRNATTMLCLV